MSGNLMNKTTAWFLVLFFWSLPIAAQPNPNILGIVVGSTDTTLGAVPLPDTGTILNNGVLTTGRQGEAFLEFPPSGVATVFKSTKIRFHREGHHVVAEMTSGAMTVELVDRQDFWVMTPKCRIAPADQKKAIYSVTLMPDRGTRVAVRQGRLAITEGLSGPTHILLEGQYASILASAPGEPGQQAHLKEKPAKSPKGTWHIGSLSHRTSLGIAAAAAASVAGSVAIPLSAGGQVASPSMP
ncbi:MAG TPA: hypothetical protein VMW54_14270 [Terriglobia bacterium]|nr:hypothetical protein [Terriglobia bacterium]